MNFDFTEEEALFKNNLRELCEKQVAPGYLERAQKDDPFNRELIMGTLKKMGLMGLDIPEKYGGQGQEVTSVMHGIIQEELGRADNAWSTTWANHRMCTNVLMEAPSEELKQKWIPALCNAEKMGAYCFTEPHCGTDLGQLATSATQKGDTWVINGSKSSISWVNADAYITAARTDPHSKGYKSIALFWVPREIPGVQTSKYTDFGLKQIGRGDVNYKDVVIPADHLITAPGAGFQRVMNIFDVCRPAIALMAIGAADVAIEKAMEFAKQRTVFGKPLSFYEEISFNFARHHAMLECSKMMAYKAEWLRDQGRWNAKEAAMAKFLGCKAAFDAIHFCQRSLGHLGYTTEYDVSQRLADVAGWAFGDGTWEVCMMITARELGGNEFLPYERMKK